MSDIKAIDYFEEAKTIVREHAAATLAKIQRKPKGYDFTTAVYVYDRDGEEWEINIGVGYSCTYDPGRYSGPWEDSYPASGEMDLHTIVVLDDVPQMLTEQDVINAASESERIEEEAWEHYHDTKNEGREP